MKAKHYFQAGLFLLVVTFFMFHCKKDDKYEPVVAYSIEPGIGDFGEVEVGNEKSIKVSIKNTGEASVKILSLSIEGANKDEFKTDAAAIEVKEGDSYVFSLQFAPDSVGDKEAKFVVKTEAGGEKAVKLKGKATEKTETNSQYSINPDKADFGELLINETKTQEFTIINSGNETFQIKSITVEGANKDEFTTDGKATEVTIRQPYKFNVTFAPTSLGDKAASLKIIDDKGSKIIPLKGKGKEEANNYTVNPQSIAFGKVQINKTSTTQLTIKNNGNKKLTIKNIAIEGTNSSEFSTTGAAKEIGPGQQYQFNVTFNPTSKGNKQATLKVADDKGEKTVSLTGNATEEVVNNYTISPSTGTFGEIEVNKTIEKQFTIQNNGSNSLEIQNISIDGTNSSEFATNGGAATVAPNGTYQFKVTFQPTGEGDKTANLKIQDNKDTKNIVLTGKAKPAGGSTQPDMGANAKVIFLHHSTGQNIWNYGNAKGWFNNYNSSNGKSYEVSDKKFPSSGGYGWENAPYDYWNIWVNHGNDNFYKTEPTLKELTTKYDVIIWKHCFTVSDFGKEDNNPDVSSSKRTLANYKKQYEKLKAEMLKYPNTRFLVWTTAVRVNMTQSRAERANQFANWVKNEWDETGDNIYVFDFYQLETEGGLVLKKEYASNNGTDSHPNESFSQTTAPKLCQRIVDVIQGKADNTSLTGE